MKEEGGFWFVVFGRGCFLVHLTSDISEVLRMEPSI